MLNMTYDERRAMGSLSRYPGMFFSHSYAVPYCSVSSQAWVAGEKLADMYNSGCFSCLHLQCTSRGRKSSVLSSVAESIES